VLRLRNSQLPGLLVASAFVCAAAVARTDGAGARGKFRFGRDTWAFTNNTVFEYKEGHAHLRKADPKEPAKRYTRRCFVMCRTAMQFYKFARFDPRGAPLDDRQLAERIRMVTRRAAWEKPLPKNQRVVFPGYADLYAMSKARQGVLQRNIGLGWPTYFRLGNSRMVWNFSARYQEQMHANLEAALAHHQLFVGYLTTFPSFTINHAVLAYAHKRGRADGLEHYLVFDPNHSHKPRVLTWSPRDRAFSYQKDWDFVGGRVRVFQVYGKPLQ
jgi:hypothetical protein